MVSFILAICFSLVFIVFGVGCFIKEDLIYRSFYKLSKLPPEDYNREISKANWYKYFGIGFLSMSALIFLL